MKNILFFFTVFSVYFSLNYYYIYKFNKETILNFKTKLIIKIFLILCSLSLIASYFFHTGTIKIVLSFIGFIWLSFIFIFLSAFIFIDLYRFIFKKTFKINVFYLATLIVLTVSIYGYFHADKIYIKNINLNSLKLTGKTYKIVQISDIHFSSIAGLKHAKNIVNKIKNLDPDLIFLTGDFIDRGTSDVDNICKLFYELKPRLGKYAVTGNHEYYTGIEYSRKVIRESGFILLENNAVNLDDTLTIVGINDITSFDNDKELAKLNELKVLEPLDVLKFTILLKHQPTLIKESIKSFDLMLSGHTHAGQIFPFNFLVKFAFPYIKGLYKLEADKYLFVTSGTGTWGPPIRLLTDSEIVVINLSAKKI